MKTSHLITMVLVLAFTALHAQNTYYAESITKANASKQLNHAADLQNCFDKNGNAMFDELYVYARIWRETQYINQFAAAGLTLKNITEKTNLVDIDVEKIFPDETNNRILWYVEPSERCSVQIMPVRYTVSYVPETNQFGGIECKEVISSQPMTDMATYQIWSIGEAFPAPDTTDYVQETQCSCQWQTPQQFPLRDYFNYSYTTTEFKYVGEPFVVEDTVGIVGRKISHETFNTLSQTKEKIPTGEYQYRYGAMQWTSLTESAFVPTALGAGTSIKFMDVVPDTVLDIYYWPEGITKDTTYTVFRYDPKSGRGTYQYSNATKEDYQLQYQYYNQTASNTHSQNIASYTAALWHYNNVGGKTTETFTHADALHYIRSGNKYILADRFDAYYESLPPFTQSGKKIYFTGSILPAQAQYTNTSDKAAKQNITHGAWAQQGDGPAAIWINNKGRNDLYFENFQLATRALTVKESEPTSWFDKQARKYIAAAIALETDGNDTHIHFRGDNLLMGHTGGKTITTLNSSAIYFNVDDKDAISLTLDDLWPDGEQESHTNGLIRLDGSPENNLGKTKQSSYHVAPAIYSGNSHAVITFNGGRYQLVPSDNTGNFSNFMTIARHVYKAPGYNFLLPDVGSDLGDATIYIKDGNFSLGDALRANTRASYTYMPDQTEYDRDYYVMYLPTNTIITGGNFENCIVMTIDGDQTVASGTPGCPTNGQETVFPYYVAFDLSGTDRKPLWQTAPDAIEQEYYNYNNLNIMHNYDLDEDYAVLYLPSGGEQQCEFVDNKKMQNWDIAFPGGAIEELVNQDRQLYINLKRLQGDTTLKGTKYFAMIELNPYYPIATNFTHSNITENEDYHISNEVYLCSWIMADKWQIKTLPFDVTDISLLSTWATDNNGNTADSLLEEKYYRSIISNSIIRGRWTGLHKEQGADASFWNLYERSAVRTRPTEAQINSVFPHVARRHISMLPVAHNTPVDKFKFQTGDGQHCFYLFEAAGKNGDAIARDQGDQFCLAWRPVEGPDENGILMHKGHTYAYMFPNFASKEEDGYNFWNGKYIVFSGPEQDVKARYDNARAPEQSGWLRITGNNSFNKCTPYTAERYDFDYTTQCFQPASVTSVHWTDAYLVGQMYMPNISINNMITIDRSQIDNAVDKIEGSLLYNTTTNNGSLNIQSFAEQTIQITSITGQVTYKTTLKSEQIVNISIPAGVYLIQSDHTANVTKIIL